jgi:hypothetical protein
MKTHVARTLALFTVLWCARAIAEPAPVPPAPPGPAPAAATTPATAPAPAVTVPAPAPAATVPAAIPAPVPPPPLPRHALGLQVGVMIPQLANTLDTNFGLKLDYGYRVWDRLSIVAGFLYTQPESHVKQADPRLPSGQYRTDTVQRQFIFTLGPLWRFLARSKGFNGYILAGARMYVLQTVTEGSSGGQAFGTNREISVQGGGVLELGGEYGIGPGAITLSLEFAGAKLPHVITGKVPDLTILLAAGYRFFF